MQQYHAIIQKNGYWYKTEGAAYKWDNGLDSGLKSDLKPDGWKYFKCYTLNKTYIIFFE